MIGWLSAEFDSSHFDLALDAHADIVSDGIRRAVLESADALVVRKHLQFIICLQ